MPRLPWLGTEEEKEEPMTETPMSGGGTHTSTGPAFYERIAPMTARFGLGQIATGILLILLGVLVLVYPSLIRWTIGIGAIVLGALVLAYAPPPTRH